ncbi:NACHT domain-containing protein [Streptomyces tendae]|uniref:NACHT domain-containing protein n=1 Tax=Streptomyces tendae TaxID=1932 RepID=UPI0036F4E618
MAGGRGTRIFLIGLAGAGSFVVVVVTVWVLAEGRSATDLVTRLGFPVALASLLVGVAGIPAVWGTLRQVPDDAAAARAAAAVLARQVYEAEQREWLRLVGGDTERINLHFALLTEGQWRPAATTTTRGSLFSDGSSGVPDVVAFYRETRPARLAVTGSPGAGKTVLALEILLALIASRSETEPVPVRLSLAEWDTSAMGLEGYLVHHLVHALDWPPHIARRLVRHRMVLPVLDGLDEMDSLLSRDGRPVLDDHGNPCPDPNAPRARAALKFLNTYQDGLSVAPLILTCRGAHYDALSEADRLRTAARIQIAPVVHEHGLAYLARRSGRSAHWNALLQHLRTHPDSPVAHALTTPWRLNLVATTYHHGGSLGALLERTDAAGLDDYLLSRLIPAVTELDLTAHPPFTRRHRPRYPAGDVQRWLSTLAIHLASVRSGTASQLGGAARTDLVLHELWPLAGRRRVRAVDAVLSAVIVLLTLPLAWLTPCPALSASAIAIVAVSAGTVAALNTSPVPHRLHWGRLATQHGRADLTLGVTCGLTAGGGLSFFADTWLGIGFGLACGLVAGLVIGAIGEPVTAADPRQVRGGDLIYGLLSATAVGLSTASVGVLLLEPGSGLVCGAVGFVSGLVGLTAGVTARLVDGILPRFPMGLAAGSPATRRYLVFLLCSRNHLPFRLTAFLEWACGVGLLRRAGSAYQFRHREIQRWLALTSSRRSHT